MMLETVRQRSGQVVLRAAFVALAAASLGACSSTPQWAKPNTWVDGVFGPSNTTAVPAETQPQESPDLANVPERPAETSSEAERQEAREGLIADRERAKHSAETLREDVDGTSNAAAAPATPVTPAAPPSTPPGSAPITQPAQPSPTTQGGAIDPTTGQPVTPSVGPQTKLEQQDVPAREQLASADLVAEGHNTAAIGGAILVPRTRVLSEVTSTAGLPSPTRRPSEFQIASADDSVGAWPAQALDEAMDKGAQKQPTPITRPTSEILATPETVYFEDGSSSLTNAEQTHLNQAAQTYERVRGQVRLIGHASPDASDTSPGKLMANYTISLKRASTVAQALLVRGVPPSAIIIEAVGDSSPVYAENAPRADAFNRRVEILFEDL